MDVNIERLAGLPGFSGFAPASEAAVAEAESALGLRFSPDFRSALLEYGCIETDNHELTGLIDSKRLNVVRVTKDMRSIYKALGLCSYVIEDTYVDGVIICQDSSGSVFQLDLSGSFKKIASSLVEYLDE